MCPIDSEHHLTRAKNNVRKSCYTGTDNQAENVKSKSSSFFENSAFEYQLRASRSTLQLIADHVPSPLDGFFSKEDQIKLFTTENPRHLILTNAETPFDRKSTDIWAPKRDLRTNFYNCICLRFCYEVCLFFPDCLVENSQFGVMELKDMGMRRYPQPV